MVQTAGYGYRLDRHVLMLAFDGGGPLQRLLLRYTQALMTQMAQTAVCNRHHSLEQQLCRWLLLTLDRLPSSELTMTQELVAGMLGVRREGVTEAAGNLQRAGLISYRRGHISVLDRRYARPPPANVTASCARKWTACCTTCASAEHPAAATPDPLGDSGDRPGCFFFDSIL